MVSDIIRTNYLNELSSKIGLRSGFCKGGTFPRPPRSPSITSEISRTRARTYDRSRSTTRTIARQREPAIGYDSLRFTARVCDRLRESVRASITWYYMPQVIHNKHIVTLLYLKVTQWITNFFVCVLIESTHNEPITTK